MVFRASMHGRSWAFMGRGNSNTEDIICLTPCFRVPENEHEEVDNGDASRLRSALSRDQCLLYLGLSRVALIVQGVPVSYYDRTSRRHR